MRYCFLLYFQIIDARVAGLEEEIDKMKKKICSAEEIINNTELKKKQKDVNK